MMLCRTYALHILASLTVGGLLALGCSSSGDDAVYENYGAASKGNGAGGGQQAGEEEQDTEAPANGVPKAATNHWDQAVVCDATFKRHAAIKDADLKDGYIRWGCGDVPGVNNSGTRDLGQEYCEYHPVAAGKEVLKGKDLPEGAKFSCLFTSVYQDSKTDMAARRRELSAALAAPANLGAAPPDTTVAMNVGFNTRGAASLLIRDCQTASKGKSPGTGYPARDAARLLDEARQATCYEASVTTLKAKASKLKEACRTIDLSVQKNWDVVKALGVADVTAPYSGSEFQRDISACLATPAANGIPWRNSDPMICARVVRAVGECGAGFEENMPPGALPTALEGFLLTGWVNRQLPSGCRKAKVAGRDYDQLVICDVSPEEVVDIRAGDPKGSDLQAYCRDAFGKDIVMSAPLRVVEKVKPRTTGDFCKKYAGQ